MSTYSMRQAEKLAGLHRASVAVLVNAGVVTPVDGAFSHEDVVVLRTAKAMRDAGISARQVVHALARLRGMLEPGRHLASVRFDVRGRTVVASDGGSRLEVWTGQRLLTLGESPAVASVASRAPQHANAQACLARAIELEVSDPVMAEAAYRRAIELDPTLEAAYLNLGAMLCEKHRCKEALDLFDEALRHDLDTPLVHFNRGTALQDLHHDMLAAEAYRRAIALDPGLADAHYNLGVLSEQSGDVKTALRHFSAYRRSLPTDEAGTDGPQA